MKSTINLNQGWNWVSFNVITDDMTINSYLNNLKDGSSGWSDGDYIKTQSTSSSFEVIVFCKFSMYL